MTRPRIGKCLSLYYREEEEGAAAAAAVVVVEEEEGRRKKGRRGVGIFFLTPQQGMADTCWRRTWPQNMHVPDFPGILFIVPAVASCCSLDHRVRDRGTAQVSAGKPDNSRGVAAGNQCWSDIGQLSKSVVLERSRCSFFGARGNVLGVLIT